MEKERFTLYIESDFLKKLKIESIKKGISISDTIVYYLKIGLDKEERSN